MALFRSISLTAYAIEQLLARSGGSPVLTILAGFMAPKDSNALSSDAPVAPLDSALLSFGA